MCDEYCFKSKNLYNYANYINRQQFFKDGTTVKYYDMSKLLNKTEPFKAMGSNSAQMTLRLLEKDWKSFFEASKEFDKNPDKFLGKPRIPKYKNKNGRHVCMLTNRQVRVEGDYLYFSFKPFKVINELIKPQFSGRLLQLRVVPQGSSYVIELVYEDKVPKVKVNNNQYIGIDLGVDNFATIVNNIGKKPIVINGKGVKSYNQHWNKEVSYYKSLAKKNNGMDWTKRLQTLTDRRARKIDYFMHCASKMVIDYCNKFDINTIIIGYNQGWKQCAKLGVNTQSFVQIPHYSFIQKLKYKSENYGINLKITEESYTSGTSFLDNEMPTRENYDISRRVYRGLFKSSKGKLINADVNAAYQIIKKVSPEAFVDGVRGVHLHPVVVNI